MAATETELRLRVWRGDQIGAERLAANLLHLDGFTSVDPQCPLGGPDGLKDARCEKNGWIYIAAAYFPTEQKAFKDVKKKFSADIKGVSKNSAQGFVFLTNQSLTPGERETLLKLARLQKAPCILFHLERIVSLLDSAIGYGARLQHLNIAMTTEEQASFFTQWNRGLNDLLQSHSQTIIKEISRKIDQLSVAAADRRRQDFGETSEFIRQTGSLLLAASPPSDKGAVAAAALKLAGRVNTGALTTNDVRLIHQALLFDSVSEYAGELRTVPVWIGAPGDTASTAAFTPPGPVEAARLLEELVEEWRSNYQQLLGADARAKVRAMATFHHRFVSIHPFIDGNGRLARFLLSQQARELLDHARPVLLDDRQSYFDALARADAGRYEALESFITQAIFGGDAVPAASMSR